MNKKAYYDILDLPRDCDDKDIKKAYKKASLSAHPDKGGSSDLFQFVNEAYNHLSDVTKRADYDRQIKKFGSKDGMGLKTDKGF